MTLNEKLNTLSNEDLIVIWDAIDQVDFTKQPDLYGVSFSEWVEAIDRELNKRNLK